MKFMKVSINPQNIADPVKRKECFTKYRNDMIEEVGTVIFLFGNKMEEGILTDAAGCLEEFEISRKRGKIIIPVASTGSAARAIMEEIKKKMDDYPYLKEELSVLENETDLQKLTDAVVRIIKKQQNMSIIV